MAVKTGLGEGAKILNITEPFKNKEEKKIYKEEESYNLYALPIHLLKTSSKTSYMLIDLYRSFWSPIAIWQRSNYSIIRNTQSIMKSIFKAVKKY